MECPLPVANPDKFWIKYNNKKKLFNIQPHLKAEKANLVPGGTQVGS